MGAGGLQTQRQRMERDGEWWRRWGEGHCKQRRRLMLKRRVRVFVCVARVCVYINLPHVIRHIASRTCIAVTRQ